jgi:hypothetical protein
MKNNFLLIITLICGISTTFGQGPERSVYATAGKVAKCQTLILGSTNTVSYTIGEPIVKWSNVDGKRIHNGFQQPDQNFAVSPNVSGMSVSDPSFLIYPNPFNNYTIIQGPEEQKGITKIQLIDQNGKLISEDEMIDSRHHMDFESNLAPGQYFLNFYNESGSLLQQTKIIKASN